MLKRDKQSSGLKSSSLSSVSTFKSLGRKLLSSKTFESSDIKKNAKPIEPIRKRSTLPGDLNTISKTKPKSIPIKNVNSKLSSPSAVRRASGTESRNNSISEKKMVYNPYGVMSPSFGNSGNSTANNTPGYSNSVNSMKSFSNSRRDASFYLHEGSQHIRILQLPVSNPNDHLPEEFQQISTQLYDNFKFENDHKTIGTGGSADVKKVVTKTIRPKLYAFKKLNMIYQETDEQYYKRCAKEFIIGKELNSKSGYGSMNIIGIYQLCKVATTTTSVRGWGYIMELAKYDLFHVMTRIGWKNVDVLEKYCVFKQIANGVKFMHDNGIVHRDLKPENVLFCEGGICKITDFGISSWGYIDPKDLNSEIKMCSGMIGSPPYAPPEVMMWDSKKNYPESLQKPCNPFLIDTYSLGVILMTLINNLIPFIESCDKDSKFREYESSYNNYIKYDNKLFRKQGYYKPGPGGEYMFAKMFKDNEVARVAWRLADPDPKTRYTMDDLFEDPWFQNIELCMDPLDELTYKSTEPELHGPPDESVFNNITNFNEGDISSTSPSNNRSVESCKQRSMIDIAHSPQRIKKNPTSLLTKGLSESNASNVPSSLSSFNYTEMSLMTSSGSGSNSSISRLDSTGMDVVDIDGESSIPIKETNLFTVEEESNAAELDEEVHKEENVRGLDEDIPEMNVQEREVESIVSNKTVTHSNVKELTRQIKDLKNEPSNSITLDFKSEPSDIFGSDLKSEPSNIISTQLKNESIRRRKKVVHHHLHVINSVSNMASSSFTNSISSIASSTGSSSFRKW